MSDYAEADKLRDRVILITGAARGIGASVAQACAAKGATVVLLDKHIPGLESVYDDIIASGAPTPAIYPLDLKGASVPDYQQLANTLESQFGRLDGLVHCAATLGQLAPVEHQDSKTWLETLHINLTGWETHEQQGDSVMKPGFPSGGWPAMGAVMSRLYGPAQPGMPPFVSLAPPNAE